MLISLLVFPTLMYAHDLATHVVDKGLLYFPELYYELFTETYIPDWSFMEDLYAGYSFFNDPSFNGFYFSFPYSFYTIKCGDWIGYTWSYEMEGGD